MRLCKDCKHLSLVGRYCGSEELNGQDPVSGEGQITTALCSRSPGGNCGPEAYGFKPTLNYSIKNNLKQWFSK